MGLALGLCSTPLCKRNLGCTDYTHMYDIDVVIVSHVGLQQYFYVVKCNNWCFLHLMGSEPLTLFMLQTEMIP